MLLKQIEEELYSQVEKQRWPHELARLVSVSRGRCPRGFVSPGGSPEGMSVTHGKGQAGKQPRREQLLEDGTMYTRLKANHGGHCGTYLFRPTDASAFSLWPVSLRTSGLLEGFTHLSPLSTHTRPVEVWGPAALDTLSSTGILPAFFHAAP